MMPARRATRSTTGSSSKSASTPLASSSGVEVKPEAATNTTTKNEEKTIPIPTEPKPAVATDVVGTIDEAKNSAEDSTKSSTEEASNPVQVATDESKKRSYSSLDANPPSSSATAGSEATTEPPQEPPKDPEDPRITKLRKQNAALEQQIKSAEAEVAAVHEQLQEKDPNKTVQKHIKLLHEYNEMRDVALGLMGMVAEKRGVVVGEVMEEFGLDVREGS